MKNRIQNIIIGCVLLVGLVLPAAISGADPVMSQVELHLFLDQVEDEMIETTQQEMVERSSLNAALNSISSSMTAGSQSKDMSDSSIKLFIDAVEENMTQNMWRETTENKLIDEALNRLSASLENRDTVDYSEQIRVLYDSEINLFIAMVEGDLIAEVYRTETERECLNKAMYHLAVSVYNARLNDTSYTRDLKDDVPTSSDIKQFINEVETDMHYFDMTLITLTGIRQSIF